MKYLLLVCVVLIFEQIHGFERKTKPAFGFGDQDYGYVEVRRGAHLFWWFYYNSMTDKNPADVPLILWLSGGPGLSGSGTGNLIGVGPTTVEGKYRNGTWIEKYNVLFVDSPVGSGFSYVDSDDLYTTDNLQIADDLLKLLQGFQVEHPEFDKTPFYIYGNSYGSKMGIEFAVLLHDNIRKNKIRCNLRGIVLGNGYISNTHMLKGFGTQLYIYGYIDQQQKIVIDEIAAKSIKFTSMGLLEESREDTLSIFANITDITQGLELYLVSKKAHKKVFDAIKGRSTMEIAMHVLMTDAYAAFNQQLLKNIMDGRIKTVLGIPDKVIWSSQMDNIVPNLYDYVVSKYNLVQYVLNETPIEVHVIVSNGDGMIAPHSIGNWVNAINWPEKENFKRSPRKCIWNNGTLEGYRKNYDKFGFYWFLDAGHLSYIDNPYGTSEVLSRMIK